MAVVQNLRAEHLGQGTCDCIVNIEFNVSDVDEEDASPLSHFMYETVFKDHSQQGGVVINP